MTERSLSEILKTMVDIRSVHEHADCLRAALRQGTDQSSVAAVSKAGRKFLENGKIELAILFLETVIEALPNPEFRLTLAEAYLHDRRVGDCINQCVACLNAYPTHAPTLRLLASAIGGVYFGKWSSVWKPDYPFDLDTALRYIDMALQLDPGDVNARLVRARILIRMADERNDEKSCGEQIAVVRHFMEAIEREKSLSIERQLAEARPPCAFIHIPKCGGSSISSALEIFSLDHRYLRDAGSSDAEPATFALEGSIDRSLLDGIPVVTSVRNIWHLLVSMHNYTLSRDNVVSPWLVSHRKTDFFDYVQAVAERVDAWPWRKLMFFPLFAQPSGDLAVDFVCRLEHVESDLNAFLSAMGRPPASVPHINRSTERDSWKRAYSDKAIQFVADTWSRDIELFGFDFDRGYIDDAPLWGDVSHLKSRIRYSVAEDRLEFRDSVL